MNCWQTLGIDPGADKKSIKLAYAKRLKITRPDDDPQGFIVLHQAYKSALESCEHSRKQSPSHNEQVQENLAASASDTSEVETGTTIEFVDEVVPVSSSSNHSSFDGNEPVWKIPGFKSHDSSGAHQPIVVSIADDDSSEISKSERNGGDNGTGSESTSSVESAISLSSHEKETPWQQDSEPTVDEFDYQHPEYQKGLDEDREFISVRAHELIASPLRVNRIEEWKFIESRASMLDLNFSAQISDLLFEIVSRANASKLAGSSKSTKSEPYVKPPVLNYLNDYFHWDKNWKKYEKTHGRVQSHAVLMLTAVNRAHDQKAKSNIALRFLAFVLDLTLTVVCLFTGYAVPEIDFLTYIGAFYGLIGIPVLEATALQGSIGKRMLKLQVVDGRGRKMHWLRSLCRHYLTLISLSFVQISVFINLFTYFRYGEFLPDKWTATYVVKRAP